MRMAEVRNQLVLFLHIVNKAQKENMMEAVLMVENMAVVELMAENMVVNMAVVELMVVNMVANMAEKVRLVVRKNTRGVGQRGHTQVQVPAAAAAPVPVPALTMRKNTKRRGRRERRAVPRAKRRNRAHVSCYKFPSYSVLFTTLFDYSLNIIDCMLTFTPDFHMFYSHF